MDWTVLIATFIAASVEFVEALTIVLAVGVSRGFRPALSAAALALVILAAAAVLIGRPLENLFPLGYFQVIVGMLLLLFGIRWLRKAILRASGWKAMHNEEEAFEETRSALGSAGATQIAFATAFNGVLLEGIEVIFIVLTLGATARNLPAAVDGALAGFVIVTAVGVALHRPLVRIPENTLKYVVGLVLTTYGTFWAGEGLGILWPGQDVFLLVVAAVILVVSLLLTARLRRVHGEGVAA